MISIIPNNIGFLTCKLQIIKNENTMIKKFLTDYYPIYKDVTDQIKTMPSNQNFEVPFGWADQLKEQQYPESDTFSSPAMLNAEMLTNLAIKCGFTTFQIAFLLLKNAFEGHVFITYHIRPEQLYNQGTILLKTRSDSMIADFYEHFTQYKAGILQMKRYLEERKEDLTVINFELLVNSILANQFIRFPVSIFSTFEIGTFEVLLPINQMETGKQFKLALMGERALGEYEIIDRVNHIYAEKFKEFGQQLRTKEEILSHYQRKIELAHNPTIHSEEELDDLMYKKLIEERLNVLPGKRMKFSKAEQDISDTSPGMLRIREKIKVLYRLISKNCAEIHSATEDDNNFPELHQIFLEANTIYNELVIIPAEAWLNYVRMLVLLSKVIVFRKDQKLSLADNHLLLTACPSREILFSTDELKIFQKNIDTGLVEFRMKSFTDYKLKFVLDDEFMEIHKHFLQKQIDFIDEQIIQLQKDIKEILNYKISINVLKPSNN